MTERNKEVEIHGNGFNDRNVVRNKNKKAKEHINAE